MRSICLLGVRVAVEGEGSSNRLLEGWIVLAIDNYD